MEQFLRVNETEDDWYARCDTNNLTLFDCSEEEFLWLAMGARRLPPAQLLPLSGALLLLFVSGVLGNAAVCVVVATHAHMHTNTNYYLANLAVSDLLLLVFGLPNDLSVYWHQYPYSLGLVFCKLRALISEAASYVSVLTIVAFSLERYLAVCQPLHLLAVAGLRRALPIVAALWLCSLLAAAPFAHYTSVSYLHYPPGSGNISLESAFCAMLELPSWYLCELSSLVFFVLPGVVILALYVRMGLQIRYVLGSTHGQKPDGAGVLSGVNGSVHGEARRAQSRKNIIRMLAAVVIAFFVCWAPFHLQRLWYIYGAAHAHYRAVNEQLFSAAGLLYYVSATVNPILYNVMSQRYRTAFKETLCCKGKQRSKSKYYRNNSSIRETTLQHTSEGAHLMTVRSRSQTHRWESGRSRNSHTSASNLDHQKLTKQDSVGDKMAAVTRVSNVFSNKDNTTRFYDHRNK